MAHEALIERLEKLDVETIEKMSPEVIARLTHHFEEFLVRNMLYIATTNYDQRRLIKVIKEAYKSWKKDTDMFWGTLPQLEVYPEYMEELQTDIECGLVITEKGIFEEDHARLKISLISSNAVPLKALQKGFESVMRTDKEKTAASNQKRLTDNSYIESLEAENARLREELAGKNNETIGEQDSPQPESSSSEIAKLKACIKELQDALNEEKAKNAKHEEEIAILCEPVKELTATQNIRLAFALQLFRAAGLKDEKLDKRNRQLIKIANLLSLLLDIHSNNKKNNPAHTCAKWLSHREYVTSTNKEQIIELNKCFAELDWEFALSLENPKL